MKLEEFVQDFGAVFIPISLTTLMVFIFFVIFKLASSYIVDRENSEKNTEVFLINIEQFRVAVPVKPPKNGHKKARFLKS